MQDWTALVAASSIAIPVTATHTMIQDESNRAEGKRITVDSDYGTSTQHRGFRDFVVDNVGRF